MANSFRKYRLLGINLLAINLAMTACDMADEPKMTSSDKILYEGISDPAILIFAGDQMYSGPPPVDEGGLDFKSAFFPVAKMAARSNRGQCLFPSPPLDQNPSTIAIGAPAQGDFVGQFECGEFRFEVRGCEDFFTQCSSRFIRVFRTERNDLVNSYFWDQCRGVYLFSTEDLAEKDGWVHSFVPSGNQRLFKDRSESCVKLLE